MGTLSKRLFLEGWGVSYVEVNILDVNQKSSFTFNDLAPFLSPANMDFSSKCIWKDLRKTEWKKTKKHKRGMNYSIAQACTAAVTE